MKPNVGNLDRILRIVLGLVVIGVGMANHSWIGALGLVPILTAVLHFCPAYCPLGISTAEGKNRSRGCGFGDDNCGK